MIPLSNSQRVSVTNKAETVEGVQGQESPVINDVHTRPVRAKSGNDSGRTPGLPAISTGHDLHLTVVDSGPASCLVGHEVHDKGAADVDNLRRTGFKVVGGGVDADAGVPAVSIILREDGIDVEGAGSGGFKDATVKKWLVNQKLEMKIW